MSGKSEEYHLKFNDLETNILNIVKGHNTFLVENVLKSCITTIKQNSTVD